MILADSLAKHAIERALERYGIVLAMAALEAKLAAGDGVILRRDRDGSDVRVIRVEGQLVTVAFYNGRLKTFLPADTPYRKRRHEPARMRFR